MQIAAVPLFALTASSPAGPAAGDGIIAGIVWQPTAATARPKGNWHRIGARTLLVQWTVVDGKALVPGTGLPLAAATPDWERIAREPWAQEVILGLAGRFDEKAARAELENLVATSARVARLPTPLRVTAWYFPVEADPSWPEAARMGPLLQQLPRPLWISVYDNTNIGAENLATWLATWLPTDVGLFFQDGVGVHAREPRIARHYADVLARRFGRHRVRVIVEAFRMKPGGGFRAASADELGRQIEAYRGHALFVFDGPHYLSDALVEQLRNSPRQ